MGWDEGPFGLVFDVGTHLGTLVAVLVFFRHDIGEMVRAIPVALGDSPPARLIRLIAIGTIPTVLVGLLFSDYIEAHLRRPIVTVFTLTLGAIGLLVVERLSPRCADRGVARRPRRPGDRHGAGGGARARNVAVGRDDYRRDAVRHAA